MDQAWDAIAHHHQRLPWVHMLRGMQLSGLVWPFASVDSTDVGRNHNRAQNTALAMVDRWDRLQTPSKWVPVHAQEDFFEEAPF